MGMLDLIPELQCHRLETRPPKCAPGCARTSKKPRTSHARARAQHTHTHGALYQLVLTRARTSIGPGWRRAWRAVAEAPPLWQRFAEARWQKETRAQVRFGGAPMRACDALCCPLGVVSAKRADSGWGCLR